MCTGEYSAFYHSTDVGKSPSTHKNGDVLWMKAHDTPIFIAHFNKLSGQILRILESKNWRRTSLSSEKEI